MIKSCQQHNNKWMTVQNPSDLDDKPAWGGPVCSLTWKLVSFNPGFFFSTRTNTWHGISSLLMVFTTWHSRQLPWIDVTTSNSSQHENRRHTIKRWALLNVVISVALWTHFHLHSYDCILFKLPTLIFFNQLVLTYFSLYHHYCHYY